MKIKKIIISLLLFFLVIPFVFADSVDITQVGYGYFYYDTNYTKHTVNWSGYDANYKFRGLADFPTTYQDEGIYLVDFGIRFHIDGNFKANKKYSITFNWVNYSASYYSSSDSFISRFSRLLKTIHCRETSFTSTGYDESHCFNSSEFVVSAGADEKSAVIVTWYFTPKVDFYTGVIYYYHDTNSSYKSFISEGWEINNISWTDVTNDAQNIINNQNQNTQNIINNQNNNTSSIVNNQNQNTQNIINNQNQNNQSIINNQNQNTQDIIDNNTACYDKTLYRSDTIETGSLWSTGQITTSNTTWGVTDYLKIKSVNIISSSPYGTVYACFYNENKVLISCIPGNTAIGKVTLPSGTVYGRFSIRDNNVPVYRVNVCSGGQQAVADTITDSNIDGANSDASNFFSGFTTETYGLTGVITAPLNVIQSITSKTCSPLVLPLPFVNQNLTLPCMGEIYTQYFGSFLTIYQTITFGIVAYWVVVRIFNLVKDFKNPDHDEIEVLDL